MPGGQQHTGWVVHVPVAGFTFSVPATGLLNTHGGGMNEEVATIWMAMFAVALLLFAVTLGS
jgi:hypothetical protein